MFNISTVIVCLHATFHPEGYESSLRESYETRNLIITRLPDDAIVGTK
jgi:hypothetical protein